MPLILPYSWEQGEHLAVVGDTGTGKSTLMAALLGACWRYYIVLRTKPDDVEYLGTEVSTTKVLDDLRYKRIIVNPEYHEQAATITTALETVWQQGGWTVYVDELFYVEKLKVIDPVERLLTQGRSKGITVVVGMQRPSRISRFALAEARHVIAFGLEGRDAKLLGESTSKAFGESTLLLDKYQFSWYNRAERSFTVARLQDLYRQGKSV